jgi:hypothetical protein
MSPAVALRGALLFAALGAALAPAPASPQLRYRDPVAAPLPADPKGGAIPGTHLWWDDPEVGAQLELRVEQRAEMGKLWRKLQEELAALGDLAAARGAYLEAVRAGELAKARERLAAWAEKADAELRGFGTLRIEILSLLDEKQRQVLQALKPDLIGRPWTPRAFWVQPAQARPAGPAKRPAPEPKAAP